MHIIEQFWNRFSLFYIKFHMDIFACYGRFPPIPMDYATRMRMNRNIQRKQCCGAREKIFGTLPQNAGRVPGSEADERRPREQRRYLKKEVGQGLGENPCLERFSIGTGLRGRSSSCRRGARAPSTSCRSTRRTCPRCRAEPRGP